MFLFDDRTDKMLDISADWCAVTGECDCKVMAHMRGGQVAAVTVEDGSNISMCRSAATAILGDAVIRQIEKPRMLPKSA
ncbi:MAG: hypothetical protein ACU0DH_06635 [Paracoccus sp. (in: a-proteobacteria)]|uniref:hypothetical protein n=1 Tax=Paracoccus sp. TaxID=267 RepID=UPI00405932E0